MNRPPPEASDSAHNDQRDGARPNVEAPCFTSRSPHDYHKLSKLEEAEGVVWRIYMIAFGVIPMLFVFMPRAAYKGIAQPLMIQFLYLWVVVCLVALARFAYLRTWGNARRLAHLSPPPEPVPRLIIVGKPEWVPGAGDLADVSFEPQLFRAGAAIRSWTGRMKKLYGWTMLLAIVGLVTWKRWLTGSFITGGINFEIGAGVLAAEAAVIFFRPTYLRVVPGRLDVLRFDGVSNRVLEVQRYDLHESSICIDLVRSFVTFRGPSGDLDLPIMLMRGKASFVQALLMGAVSTHAPGPVSDDELTG